MYGEGFHPHFSVISYDFFEIFFTEERSYQGLKDGTSFGLLSDKSAEEENSNFCQILHTGHFRPLCSYAN